MNKAPERQAAGASISPRMRSRKPSLSTHKRPETLVLWRLPNLNDPTPAALPDESPSLPPAAALEAPAASEAATSAIASPRLAPPATPTSSLAPPPHFPPPPAPRGASVSQPAAATTRQNLSQPAQAAHTTHIAPAAMHTPAQLVVVQPVAAQSLVHQPEAARPAPVEPSAIVPSAAECSNPAAAGEGATACAHADGADASTPRAAIADNKAAADNKHETPPDASQAAGKKSSAKQTTASASSANQTTSSGNSSHSTSAAKTSETHGSAARASGAATHTSSTSRQSSASRDGEGEVSRSESRRAARSSRSSRSAPAKPNGPPWAVITQFGIGLTLFGVFVGAYWFLAGNGGQESEPAEPAAEITLGEPTTPDQLAGAQSGTPIPGQSQPESLSGQPGLAQPMPPGVAAAAPPAPGVEGGVPNVGNAPSADYADKPNGDGVPASIASATSDQLNGGKNAAPVDYLPRREPPLTNGIGRAPYPTTIPSTYLYPADLTPPSADKWNNATARQPSQFNPTAPDLSGNRPPDSGRAGVASLQGTINAPQSQVRQ